MGTRASARQAVCQQERGGRTQWRPLLLHGGQDDVGAVDLVHVPAGLGLVEPLSRQVLPLDVQLCAGVEYIFHFAEGDDRDRKDQSSSSCLFRHLDFLDAALNKESAAARLET